MLVFLCIIIVVFTLLSYGFRAQISGHIDMFNNDGFVEVRLFGIKVFGSKVYFEHNAQDKNNSIVLKHGRRADEIHLSADEKDKKSVVSIIKNPAFRLMLVAKVDACFVVGKNGDAVFTSLLLGGIRVVFYGVMAFIKSQQTIEINANFEPQFNCNALETDFLSIISLSFANIIYGFVGDFFARKKLGKIKR